VTRLRPPSLLVVLATAALAVGVPAAPARAHTELIRTAPAAQSATTSPVTAVTLTFSGLIKAAGATVRVTGADNTSYSDGAPRAVDKTVTQEVTPLPVGTITVTWRVISVDGHPIQGRFGFTNRAAPPPASRVTTASPTVPPTAPPSAEGSPVAGSPAPAGDTSGDADSSRSAWWAVLTPVVLVLALAVGLLRRRRRQGPRA
jgi:methionine-rich copper-binding protein CopC